MLLKIDPQVLIKIGLETLLKNEPELFQKIDPQTLLKTDLQMFFRKLSTNITEKVIHKRYSKSDAQIFLKCYQQILLKIDPKTLL